MDEKGRSTVNGQGEGRRVKSEWGINPGRSTGKKSPSPKEGGTQKYTKKKPSLRLKVEKTVGKHR